MRMREDRSRMSFGLRPTLPDVDRLRRAIDVDHLAERLFVSRF